MQHYRGEQDVARELAGRLPDDSDQVRLYRALTQGEKGKGQLVIRYTSLDELQGVLAHIR